jgi:hypothetical protein
MTAWAKQTHQSTASNANNSELQARARSIYDADSPSSKSLTKKQELGHLKSLHRLGLASPKIQVYPQSGGKSSTVQSHFSSVGLDRAASEFSYRIMPADRSGIKSKGRVTLNFDPKRGGEVAYGMANQLLQDPNVTQTKMMGPRNLGQRTDDAILYTKKHDFSAAIKTGKSFGDRFGSSLFVDHTPLGMEPIPGQVGRSYSEAVPDLSSSHGSARKVVIAQAVESFRDLGGNRGTADENIAGHVGFAALKHGLNPEAPAFAITQGRKDMLVAIRAPATHQNFRDNNTDKRTAKVIGVSISDAKSFRERLLKRYK